VPIPAEIIFWQIRGDKKPVDFYPLFVKRGFVILLGVLSKNLARRGKRGFAKNICGN
jgi:hypothetical protein